MRREQVVEVLRAGPGAAFGRADELFDVDLEVEPEVGLEPTTFRLREGPLFLAALPGSAVGRPGTAGPDTPGRAQQMADDPAAAPARRPLGRMPEQAGWAWLARWWM